jgi:chemosensory pili system protein ChpA (sensor histidine kinase/response regulator)
MSRILIVEDLVAGREAMAKLLQREGYDVAGARNGAEALARLKEGGIDLILLDHMMPEVDGLTFLSGIRRFPKWKNMPVIMFTGLKDRNHLMKAQTMGVKEYMVKSEYTMQDLVQLVRKHVQPTPPAPPPEQPPAATAAPLAG